MEREKPLVIDINGVSGLLGSRLAAGIPRNENFIVRNFREPRDLGLLQFDSVFINASGPSLLDLAVEPKEQKLRLSKMLSYIDSELNLRDYGLIINISTMQLDPSYPIDLSRPGVCEYVETKRICEHFFRDMATKYHIPTFNIRLGNCVAAPLNRKTSSWRLLVPSLVKKLCDGSHIEIKNPMAHRWFVPFSSLLEEIRPLLQNNVANGCGCRKLDLRGLNSMTIGEVVEIVNSVGKAFLAREEPKIQKQVQAKEQLLSELELLDIQHEILLMFKSYSHGHWTTKN